MATIRNDAAISLIRADTPWSDPRAAPWRWTRGPARLPNRQRRFLINLTKLCLSALLAYGMRAKSRIVTCSSREDAMALYIVSCAMRDPMHDYSLLWQALDRKGAKRAMEAVWLLESDETIAALTQSILPMLRDDDRLLIGSLGIWSATHLLEDAQDFLKKTV